MIKLIRLILYKTFGLKAYLTIVSHIYLDYIRVGCGKKKYPELHFLKKIIKPGFTCIDIGANMGYYSVSLSKYAGSTGKVYAVEPVPLFGEIWKINTRFCRNKNLLLLPYALGDKESSVQMGMPLVDGIVHHGMTKIVSGETSGYEKKFDVEMKNPDILFNEIPKIDFIKVDVEGYESIVFGNMTEVLHKHMPLIQSELSGAENRKAVIDLLLSLGYTAYILENNNLKTATEEICRVHNGDFYFKAN